ncbi:MAG: serine/threonine-protein kinase, partial [Nannocystaceae bacterium]
MERSSIGGYRLLQRVTTGGPGCLHYFATREDDPGDVAEYFVKALIPGQPEPEGELLLAQFEHETRLLETLNHPNFASLHAAGEEDGVMYYVVDRVIGVDLADLLGHRAGTPRPLSAEIAVYLMAQVANAVVGLHGIEQIDEHGAPDLIDALHRDLCPANVLLSTDGDVLLADLGTATSRWLPHELTVRDAGARAYMAPERVIGGGEATVQTDLFALAVILWEILRGERCLRGDNDISTMENIARFDIGSASNRVTGLSPRLSEVLRRNLDKDPGRRFATSHQVLSRLSQATESEHAGRAR